MKLQQQLSLSHLLVTLLSVGLLFPLMLLSYGWFSQSRFAAGWILDEAHMVSEMISDYLAYSDLDLSEKTASSLLFSYAIPEVVFYKDFLDEDAFKDMVILEKDIVPMMLEGFPLELSLDVLDAPQFLLEPSHIASFEILSEPSFAITNATGQILATTHQYSDDEMSFGNLLVTHRQNLIKEQGYIYAKSPIVTRQDENNDVILGWVILRYPHGVVAGLITDISQDLLIFAVGVSVMALIVSVLAGRYLSRRFGKRITDLQLASTAISQGNFDLRLDTHGQDEISQLAQAFSQMAQRLKRQMTELQELADYNQQLMFEKEGLARAEERHHLARELHDAVKQQIFALHLGMGSLLSRKSLEGAQSKDNLKDLGKLSHEILIEMDHIIRELRPASLEDRGLVAALSDYVEQFEASRGIKSSFEAHDGFELSIAQEQCLYRIAQEALNNVYRHAAAKHVALTLKYSFDEVLLYVADDGDGFDVRALRNEKTGSNANSTASSKTTGTGIQGMHDRLKAFSGSLHIDSEQGRGTRISARLPIPRKPPQE